MLPEHAISARPVPAPFLTPYDRPFSATENYEMGGVALRDPSQGLRVKVWKFKTSGSDVTVEADDEDPVVLFSRAGITWSSGCFDQNMNPCVAFVQDDDLWLWWFDTLISAQVFSRFSGQQPHVCLDDKRPTQAQANDVIFAYVRAGQLYFREQRDRFSIERNLVAVPDGFTFTKMGMNTVLRLQFQFDPPEDE